MSSRVLPVAAYVCMRIIDRPVVEVFGLVLAILNDPHSGRPTPAHPSLDAMSRSTSFSDTGLPGYPSAAAIDAGMLSTTGVRANEVGSGTRSAPAAAATRSVHSVDAGDHTTGQ